MFHLLLTFRVPFCAIISCLFYLIAGKKNQNHLDCCQQIQVSILRYFLNNISTEFSQEFRPERVLMQEIRGQKVAFRKSKNATIIGISPPLVSAACSTEENDLLMIGENVKMFFTHICKTSRLRSTSETRFKNEQNIEI